MSTYTQILYQVVYSTKNRTKALNKENRNKLFKYIAAILRNKNCHVYQINGVEDHIHIITHLHQSIALASLIKDIKISSSNLIKEEDLFPHFIGWQNGYAAFTYSYDAKDNLIEYVKNQEEHHKQISFKEEFIGLLKTHHIEYDEKYLW